MTSLSLRNRLIIILYIISFTVSVFLFAYVMDHIAVDVEYTSYKQYAVQNDHVYFVQNDRGRDLLFSINSRGRVEKIFTSGDIADSRIAAVSTCDGSVYVVQQTFVDQFDAKKNEYITVPGYRIMCLSDDLNVVSRTSKFVLEEDIIFSGFSAEETGLFMTFITKDGSYVKVYSVDRSNLKDIGDDSKDDVKIESIRAKKAPEKRFYSEALYSKGELYVRADNDVPTGIFALDPVLKNIIDNMKLGPIQIFTVYATYLIWYVAILLVWFVVLYLVIRVLTHKNRSFYYLVIAEVVLFLAIGACCLAVAGNYQNAKEIEHSRFAVTSMLGLAEDAGLYEHVDYSDPSYYETERYNQIKRALTGFVKREGNSDIFYDVMVERLKDDVVCASASGRNQEVITDTYSSRLDKLADDIALGNRFTAADFTYEGQKYRAVAVANALVAPDYALVGIINVTSIDSSVVVDNLGVFIFFLLLFAISSAFVVLIWFLHMRDLTALEQALADTALGNAIPKRPATLGTDIKDMWDAVAEIQKRVEGMQYSKLRILEAYYRFAPKNIELILEKNSIIEVHNGAGRDFEGTLGSINIDIRGGKSVKKLDYLIEAIGDYVKNHEAMIVGKAPDMSNIQMLFSDKEITTTKELVDLNMRFFKDTDHISFTMLLIYDSFNFGVVGNEDESSTYLYAEEKELIMKMTQFVSKLNLGLVITDKVVLRENYGGATRFIGYGGRDRNGELVGLYEVLDFHRERERVEKITTLERFNEALKLYYDKDFYLARNRFSDILKEAPSDLLARWYVFESEKYLHESAEGNDYKILNV